MKNADKIINYVVNTKNDSGEDVQIVTTSVLYEDGTKEEFTTLNPTDNDALEQPWITILSTKVANLDYFLNDWDKAEKDGKMIVSENDIRYVNHETVYNDEDIVKAQAINVLNFQGYDNDVAIVQLLDKKGAIIDSFSCNLQNVDQVLEEKVDNYQKLMKKNLISTKEYEINEDLMYESVQEDQIDFDDDDLVDLDTVDEVLEAKFILGNNLSEDYVLITSNKDNTRVKSRVTVEEAEGVVGNLDRKHISYYVKTDDNFVEIKERKFNRYYNQHIAGKETDATKIIKDSGKKTKKSKEKKKTEPSNNKPLVQKVVFYKRITEYGNEEISAVLYYDDGSTKEVNKDSGLKAAIAIADRMGVSENDYQKLFDDKILVTTDEASLLENNENYKAEAIELGKNTKKDNEAKKKHKWFVRGLLGIGAGFKWIGSKALGALKWTGRKIKATKVGKALFSGVKRLAKKTWGALKWIGRKIKTTKLGKAVVAVIGAGVLFATGSAIFGAHNDNDNDTKAINPSQSQVQNDNNNLHIDDIPSENVVYTQSYDILNNLKNKNDDRYNFLNNVGKTLNNYNMTEATKVLEANKGTKLAHSFDELAIQYIIYNDVPESEIHNIFGNEFVDKNELMNSFEMGVNQDSLAHNLQINDIDKSNMFKTEEAEAFYDKYNNLFTEMNNTSEKTEKQNYVSKFYDMVRSDFAEMSDGTYNDVKGYQVSILEFTEAMEHMNITTDNQLTKQEKDYIDGLTDHFIAEKINHLAVIQNARALVNPEFNEIDTLPSVIDYEEMLVKELNENNNYYVDEASRDVRNYDSYNNHINGDVTLEKEEQADIVEEQVKETPSTTPSYSNNDYYYNGGEGTVDDSYEPHSTVVDNDSTNPSDNIVDDDSINPDDSIVDDDSINPGDSIENNDWTVPVDDQVVADSDAASQIIPSEDMAVADDDSNQITEEDTDSYVDSSNDEISLDDFISDNYTTSDGSTISDDSTTVSYEYNDGVIGGNDNYSESYTNDSTSDTTAVMPNAPLPDPNTNASQLSNEQLAEMMVEDMANNPTAYDNGTAYSLHL